MIVKKYASVLTVCGCIILLFSGVCQGGEFDVSTHGYFRFGDWLNSEGSESGRCTRAEGAFAKTRFGNECEDFIELQVFSAYKSQGGKSIEYVYGWDAYQPDGGRPQILARDENFISYRNNYTLWLGKRTYKRHEAHMIDYKFFHLRGNGLGVEDVEILSGHGALALFKQDGIIGIDIQYQMKKELGNDLLVTYQGVLSHAEMDGNFSKEIGQVYGGVVSIKHARGIENKTSFKVSSGPLMEHELPNIGNLIKSDSVGRLFINEFFQDTENYSVASIILYERRRYKYDVQEDQVDWKSVGFQATRYLTENIGLTYNVGANEVNRHNAEYKSIVQSAAFEIKPKKGFFERPVFRIFYSNIKEKKSNQGSGLHRFNMGIQFEYWW